MSKSRDLVPVNQLPRTRETVQNVLGKKIERRLLRHRKSMKKLAKYKGSKFKEELPDIFKLIATEASTEEIHRAFLTASLTTVLQLIPKLEQRANETTKGYDVQALNMSISQGRELLHDLQSLTNKQELIARIGDMAIDPSYNRIVSILIDLLSHLREEVLKNVKEGRETAVREAFQSTARQYGEYLVVNCQDLKTKLAEMLE